jgi:hypothetical protein
MLGPGLFALGYAPAVKIMKVGKIEPFQELPIEFSRKLFQFLCGCLSDSLTI